ncbi:hypothetical protein GT370_08040 [Acidocella sp. MX-AZ03]|uniref:hypothetical protein n=1 Tax=Acidocella sp. MX-AZ03 TaxID=2697363 RepID=UPI0022DE268A|nr:hypothetical protein [Acidocella sp. MX-AZ03]WBO60700.1 hypothetical protein GT370_08040 [Acidocella sp. MX-AZ03]
MALYTGTVLNQGLLSGGGGAFIGLWMGGGSVQNIGTILGHAALAMQGGSFTNGGLVEGAPVALDLAGGHSPMPARSPAASPPISAKPAPASPSPSAACSRGG